MAHLRKSAGLAYASLAAQLSDKIIPWEFEKMKFALFALLLLAATNAQASNVLGTARNENGTVIEFSDGTFSKYCGEQNVAAIIQSDGTRTPACYFDNGHVVTVTPVFKNGSASMILGALAGQNSSPFRLGAPFTLPSTAVSWNSSESSGWVTP